MKTNRERADERRQEKLDQIAEQVENGSLVIRRMNAEELQQYPPRPVDERRTARRGAAPKRPAA